MKKPSLSDLASKKPAAAAEASDEPTVREPAKRAVRSVSPAYDGKKAILVRVELEGWRALRDLAAELTISTGEQVSMQSLLVDAINGLLKEHGRSPVA